MHLSPLPPRSPAAIRLLAGFALLATSFAWTWSASGQPLGRGEKASLEALTDRTAYEPGSDATIVARMRIERGWHTNSHQPTFDYLIATTAQFLLPDGWSVAQVVYPPGEMKSFAFADQPISVYDGTVEILATLEIPRQVSVGDWPIEVALTYQACDDRSCLPPVTTTSELTLQIGAGGVVSTDPVFASPPVAEPDGPRALRLTVILILGMIGGLILNAMPCVLPVLSLKLFGLVKSAGQGRSEVVVGALATSVGIILSFWALALAAVLARSAGAAVGWGVQFQEPIFVVVLAIIVVLFCLNLWGIFEIPLPARLARLADSGPREGIPGHLASGLFATLMATPCSAPFLGTAVGFALSQPPLTIFTVFTAIAVGMALPYLVLAVAPGTTRFLPRPGPWMEELRVVMGFLLAAAAVWLFYILAAQMSRERLAFIELSLLALAMFVWMRHQTGTRKVLRLISLLGIFLSSIVIVVLATGASKPVGVEVAAKTQGLIPWVTFDRQEAERLAATGQLVFVDITADWCFTCKVNERLVLETPEVAAVFDKLGVVPMQADWTNRSDVITKFLSDHGRYGIPFYLLYRPGDTPHVFSELLSKDELIEVIESAARAGS